MDKAQRKISVNEHQQLLSRLEHASRLTLAGQMAAAIAHDLNQPLTGIANLIEIGIRRIQAEPQRALDHLEPFHQATEQVLRAGMIVRRTLSFARRSEPQAAPANLVDLTQQVMAFMTPDARLRQVTLEAKIPSKPLYAKVDSTQIQQVLCNLIRNAIDALDRAAPGGRARRARVCVSLRRAPGQRACFAVADNGPGFAPESQARAFEAFASTKSHGLGLGLWICRSLVEAHGGSIKLAPSRGRGACIQFWIPLL